MLKIAIASLAFLCAGSFGASADDPARKPVSGRDGAALTGPRHNVSTAAPTHQQTTAAKPGDAAAGARTASTSTPQRTTETGTIASQHAGGAVANTTRPSTAVAPATQTGAPVKVTSVASRSASTGPRLASAPAATGKRDESVARPAVPQ